jgi:hypothetical protein
MTTTVKVAVNGNYIATVKQDGNDPVEVKGGEERAFNLPHPADSSFRITERMDEAKIPASTTAPKPTKPPAAA